jgi:cytoskeletal protein CcmA (bactofilin family)
MIVVALLTSIATAGPPEVPLQAPETPIVQVQADIPAALLGPPVFVMDDDISVSNPSNDAFGLGGRVELDGPVGDNAYLLGGDVVIREAVHGDLLVAGGSVRVEAPIDGDVYAVGGEIVFTPDARIGGHLSVAGGEVDMNGLVTGDIMVGAGRLNLGGTVHGNVTVEAGEIVFGEGASVGGDLNYTTPVAANSAEDIVAGTVTWTEGNTEGVGKQEQKPSFLGALLGWTLWTGWSYVSKLVVGIALLLLFGATSTRVSRMMVEKPAQSLGYGLAGFLLLPMASLLAMVLIIPLPLGFLGMATFFVLLYICQLFAAQAIGDLILRRARPDVSSGPALALAIGLVPFVLFTSLPWIGFIVWYIATLMGAGAVWMRLHATTTSKTTSKTTA